MASSTIGILLMAYGTPSRIEDIEPYYTHIRHGHPPTTEQLQDLLRRYDAIGGLSPLNKVTKDQAQELEKALNRKNDRNFRVYLGMKHSTPFIDDAVKEMVEDGVTTAVGLVLAPHYSTMSVGTYHKEARVAAQKYGLRAIHLIASWHMQDAFLDALCHRVQQCAEKLDQSGMHKVKTVFSAHSLPERILQDHDPYVSQLLETSKAIAQCANIADWQFAWQSAGRTKDVWLGPDILLVIKELANTGYDGILSCPVGFVSDHLEVLYDLDREASAMAASYGLSFERTTSLNATPQLIEALVSAIDEALADSKLGMF